MKALILAGGLGSRLKHETINRPKALVDVGGKPILYYQLVTLINTGIQEFIIVLGYKADMIPKYIREVFPELNVTYVTNEEYDSSNSSYSFWQARELVRGESYLHFNCDILFSPELLRRVVESPYSNVLAVRSDLELGNQMENVTLNGDRIINMSLTNTPEAVGKAFGIAKLSAESTEYIIHRLKQHLDHGDKNQNYYGFIRKGVKELEYRAVLTDKNHLQEINTLDDYFLVSQLLVTGDVNILC